MKVRAKFGPAQYADKAGEVVIKRGPRAVMAVQFDRQELFEIVLDAVDLIRKDMKRDLKAR